MFALRPDLLLSRDNWRAVADTKWKLLDQGAVRDKYKVSQADMYQLFAYGKKFLADQERAVSILIYPMSEQFSEPLPVFEFDDRASLLVTPFDCETARWKLPESIEALLTA